MVNPNVTKEDIEKFLKENARKMYQPEYYYGLDTNQDPPENYDKAKLRIFVGYLSPGDNRGVANTMAALNWLLKEKAGDDVFVDYCYFLSEQNKELFEKNGIPYEFGCGSHRPVRDFDLFILSSAICTECLNITHLLKGLGIPLTIEERAKDLSIPPIIYGGAAANEQGIILGPIYNKDGSYRGKSLVDMCTYGYGERMLPVLSEALIQYKSEGGNMKDKTALKEWLITHNVLHDIIFYPDKYEWVYAEDRFTIKQIKKLDDRLPDRVRYNQIRWTDFEGFPKKIFNVSGENADSHDVMISSGCSGSSSTCSFCMEATVAGYYRERSLDDVVKSMKEVRGWAACNNLSHYSYNMNYYGRFGDLLVETAKIFKHTSLRNERLDVVANAPDQLMLAKRMGLQRFSGAIEGMGDTIRNGLLNKNLPPETLLKAGKVIFSLKLMHFKMGMIVTGDETKESMDEFIKEMDDLIKARDEMGAHTSFQQNFCLTADAISAVHGVGLVRQDELPMLGVGYTIRSVEDTGLIEAKSNGVKQCVRITLENGAQITGTLYHPVCKWNKDLRKDQDFTYMQDLKVGDLIYYKVGTEAYGPDRSFDLTSFRTDSRWSGRKNEADSLVLNKDLAYALGVLVGDGNINTNDNRVEWCLAGGKDDASGSIIKEVFQGAGFRISECHRSWKGRKLNICGVDCVGSAEVNYVRVNSRQLKKFLLSEGFCQGAKNKRVPDMIFKGTKEVQCGFLKGLWSSDGSITSQRNSHGWLQEQIAYHSASEQLVRDVQQLLNNIGVLCRVHQRQTGLWELNVYKPWYKKFMELVGSTTQHDKLDQRRIRQTHIPRCGDYVGLEVVAVERVEDQETFAITTGDGRYITNGIVSHNTPLVLYSQTPLRWRERKTAKASFLGERNMGYYIEACQKRGIRTKFNGRGPGTWIEQLLMDFGPAGTDWMVGATEKGLSYGRHFNDRNREQVLEALTERGYKPLFFCEERPDDFIFPNDHIIYVTDKLKEMWLERWHKKDFRTPLCLRTLANKEGAKCHGCKQCQTAEEIKSIVKRDLTDHSTPDDVMNAFSDNRHVDSLLVVVKMRPGYDLWSKDTLSHYITSLFLRQGLVNVRDGDIDAPIANSFYGVGTNTYSWTTANGQKCWGGGVWCFEIQLKERGFYQDFVELIPKVNGILKTCQVQKIWPDMKKMDPKRPDSVSWVMFSKEITANGFKDRINGWLGKTRVAVKSMGGMVDIEEQLIPQVTVQSYSAVQAGGGCYIHASLPCFVNPYLAVSGIIGKKYEQVLATMVCNILDHGKEIDGTCACGRHLAHSLITNQASRVCQTCMGRAFLKKITTKA